MNDVIDVLSIVLEENLNAKITKKDNKFIIVFGNGEIVEVVVQQG